MHKYPNFDPSAGNLTYIVQKDYIQSKIKTKKLDANAFENKDIISLIASNDPTKPIYFWQLYSILGEAPIHTLIHIFYENIFKDPNDWFREEFEDLGTIEYHVNGQKKFWIDVMAGGVKYIGGLKKLNLRHKLVKNIMTQEGANLWMNNMKKTLNDERVFFSDDTRVIPCILDFLNFFMERYSVEFDFNFYQYIDFKLVSKI